MISIASFNTSVGDLQRNYLSKLAVSRLPNALPSYSIPSCFSKQGAQVVPLDGDATSHSAPSVGVSANTPTVDSGLVDLLLTKGIFPERVTQQIEMYWGGEKVYYSGRDESNKKGTLTFRLPESMGVKDFWEACKDLTGTLGNHAAVPKINAVMDLDVFLVNTGKNVITDYRGLRDVQVWSVKAIDPDKEGSGIMTFQVDITWDRVVRNAALRGTVI